MVGQKLRVGVTLVAVAACAPASSPPAPPVVVLDPIPSAGGSVATAPRTALVVRGDQPGVTAVLDGEPVGPVPLDRDVAPGPHHLHFAGDAYAPLDVDVKVARGEVWTLEALRLRLVRAKVTFLLGTEGARVTLEHDGDTREIPSFPITVALDPSKSWTLHASKAGHCDLTLPIDFTDGRPERLIDLELKVCAP